MKKFFYILLLPLLVSCTNNSNEVSNVTQTEQVEVTQTSKIESTPKVEDIKILDETIEIDEAQPVGIASSKTGRLFISFPRFTEMATRSLVEYKDGNLVSFPSETNNAWQDGVNNKDAFISIQNVFIDSEDTLWALDAANPLLGEIKDQGAKLIKINLRTNTIERTYHFDDPTVVFKNSFLNDFRIDLDNNKAYIVDTAIGAIIVLDLESGMARRVLEGDPSVKSDVDYDLVVHGKKMNGFSVDINNVALSTDNMWFYFRPETSDRLYRIESKYLADETMSNEDLSQKIEKLDDIGHSNGMTIDSKNNLYLTNAKENSLKVRRENGTIETIYTDDDLIWPDTVSLTSDEMFIYITNAQVNNMGLFAEDGNNQFKLPFTISKIRLK